MLVFAAILFGVSALPEGKDHPVAWRDLSGEIGKLTLVRGERRLFREQSKLAAFLHSVGAKRPVPQVDFSTRQLLIVSPGPRSSPGYAIDVLSVRERGGKITVRIRERTPRLGERVAARVTYPYRLLSLPAGKDVYVDWLGR